MSAATDDDGHTAASHDLGWRDPSYVARVMSWLRVVMKGWYRSEVHGLDHLPEGRALVVSNHSGGLITVDVAVLAVDLVERFGPARPFYLLSHDVLFSVPGSDALRRAGLLPARRENAEGALRSGAVVQVFPGGDRDAFRPTWEANTIDFHGRRGYVRTAIETGAPIVPVVYIGGQENQLYLTRGETVVRLLGLKDRLRTEVAPLTVGLPFGLSVVFPVNVPLPTKIVARMLEPIDVVARFGPDPDVEEVDDYVQAVMQEALDAMARQRWLPVIG